MKPIDFCKNSLTLSQKERDYANGHYNNLVNQVYELAIQSPIVFNVYIGGSLALAEPSLIFTEGVLSGLHSDIDFFVVVQNYQDAPRIVELFKSLENVEAHIPRSLHIAPKVVIPSNLCFPSIDDLLCGVNTPILEKFDIADSIPNLIRNPRTMANLFICRTGAMLSPYYITSHQYSNLDNNKQLISSLDRLKMIFAGLRLQFYGVVDDLHGNNDIAKLIPSGLFDNILDGGLIRQLLGMREKYDENLQLPEIDYYQFYRQVWISKLKLIDTINDADLAHSVIKTFFNYPLPLDYLLGLLMMLNLVALSQTSLLYPQLIKYIERKLDYKLSVEVIAVLDKLSILLKANACQDELSPILMEVHRLTLQEHTNMLTPH